MLDTAKVIRILGYIVYTILWSPVILLIAVAGPIWVIFMCIRAEMPVSKGLYWMIHAFKVSIEHDMNFIKTGVW